MLEHCERDPINRYGARLHQSLRSETPIIVAERDPSNPYPPSLFITLTAGSLSFPLISGAMEVKGDAGLSLLLLLLIEAMSYK